MHSKKNNWRTDETDEFSFYQWIILTNTEKPNVNIPFFLWWLFAMATNYYIADYRDITITNGHCLELLIFRQNGYPSWHPWAQFCIFAMSVGKWCQPMCAVGGIKVQNSKFKVQSSKGAMRHVAILHPQMTRMTRMTFNLIRY